MNTRQYAVAARIRLALFLLQRDEARRALCSWSHAGEPREPGWIQAYDEVLDIEVGRLLSGVCLRGERLPRLPDIDTTDASLVGWARAQYASTLQRAHNDDLPRGIQSQIARKLMRCLDYEEDLVIGHWEISAHGVDYTGPAVASAPGVDFRGRQTTPVNVGRVFAALTRGGRLDRGYDEDPPLRPAEAAAIRSEAQALRREQARARVAVEPRESQPRRHAVPDFPAQESWVDQDGIEHDGPPPRSGGRQHPGRGDASSEARRELREVLKRYRECELLSRNDRLKAADEFHGEMARIRSMLPDGFVLEVNPNNWHARIMKMNPAYIRQLEKAKQADKVRKGTRRLTVGRRRGPVPGTGD